MVHDKMVMSLMMSSLFPQLSELRSLPTRTPLASVSIKFFGQEIAFANIDKSIIEQAIAVRLQSQGQNRFNNKLPITFVFETQK